MKNSFQVKQNYSYGVFSLQTDGTKEKNDLINPVIYLVRTFIKLP